MFQEKIVITPFFEFWMELRAMRITRGFCGTVPVNRVLLETVIRSQIKPAAKPPNGGRTPRLDGQSGERLSSTFDEVVPARKKRAFMCTVGTYGLRG